MLCTLLFRVFLASLLTMSLPLLTDPHFQLIHLLVRESDIDLFEICEDRNKSL